VPRQPEHAENDVDALFSLPLSEFTPARNALAARLKREGHADEANRVKAIGKPSTSAWAVNQLYWKHRELFNRLLEAGQDYREAQAAQLAGRPTDLRKPGDARRTAISELSRLAAGLLQEAGHNPAPEIMRRISTTLEAMSAYATAPGSRPGRLTEDVDAPGFDALTALLSGSPPPPKTSAHKARDVDETHQTGLPAAKSALREAQRNLEKARAKAQDLLTALKKATADSERAEKAKIKAEESLRHATDGAENAVKHLRSKEKEAEHGGQAVASASRAVEEAQRHLDSLLRRVKIARD
jgi:hypothetical protein